MEHASNFVNLHEQEEVEIDADDLDMSMDQYHQVRSPVLITPSTNSSSSSSSGLAAFGATPAPRSFSSAPGAPLRIHHQQQQQALPSFAGRVGNAFSGLFTSRRASQESLAHSSSSANLPANGSSPYSAQQPQGPAFYAQPPQGYAQQAQGPGFYAQQAQGFAQPPQGSAQQAQGPYAQQAQGPYAQQAQGPSPYSAQQAQGPSPYSAQQPQGPALYAQPQSDLYGAQQPQGPYDPTSAFAGFGLSAAQQPQGPNYQAFAPPAPPLAPPVSRVRNEAAAAAPVSASSRRKVFRARVNTNIVAVKLAALASDQNCALATGDPLFCENPACRCVFSSISKLVETKSDEGEDEKEWVCEFCGQHNKVMLEEGEVPQMETVNYILEPAPVRAQDSKGEDSTCLIFVIDVSGSMCVTQQVQGNMALKGAQRRNNEFDGLLSQGDQGFGHQRGRPQVTYVSRLQSVQAAVSAQLTALQKSHPNKRVALVTFGNDVRIVGDGSSPEVVVTGDNLRNMEALQQVGQSYLLSVPISQSMDELIKKVFSLEEGGQTALGPALVVAVAMAAHSKGSKVILCTDGLANIGLGALDGVSKVRAATAAAAAAAAKAGAVPSPAALPAPAALSPGGPSLEVLQVNEEVDAAENFYENVGNTAAQAGVTVSFVSIADAECRLENLGRVADLTGGEVTRINPLELTTNFQGILEKPIIATNVQAIMLLHNALQFSKDVDRDEAEEVGPDPSELHSEGKEEGAGSSKVARRVQDIGNALMETEIFFEYDILPAKVPQGLTHLPFQVQINYTQLDGAKCVRVISQQKAITRDAAVAQQDLNMAMLAANAAQKSAALAQRGLYNQSRAVNLGYGRMMQERAVTPAQVASAGNFLSHTRAWDQEVQQQQQMEHMSSASPSPFSSSSSGAPKSRKERASERGDQMSSAMYRNKKCNSKMF